MNSEIPKLIFGTSGLGNLFTALDDSVKNEIIKQSVEVSDGNVMFDSAGKYGAGLALESLGKGLKKMGIGPNNVLISNKLAWKRVPLLTREPTFEPGVWKDLQNDAVQNISYDGIIECFEQGNELLGDFSSKYASVHDPDEFLDAAKNEEEYHENYQKILEAYQALNDLKTAGKIKKIGIGAKNWKVIQKISADVKLDWVMIANSLTIYHHPVELLDFVTDLSKKGIHVINSAVFHSGFLVGGSFMDYKLAEKSNPKYEELFKWRDTFFDLCQQFSITPAHACVQYAFNVPGVKSIALNTTKPGNVSVNYKMTMEEIPAEFWSAVQKAGLTHFDLSQKSSLG
ncbi:MAG: aldo/keto reductase [Cytophagaceae bacterium]|nr:aldo/keto reductase [Cytophagaceae bacterium]